jgi:type I restriction enzyme S subunit
MVAELLSDNEDGRGLGAYSTVTLGRQRTPEHDSGPFMIRYLRAANVKDGVLDLSDVKEMNFTPSEQDVFRLQPGDILVSEGAGSLIAVGTSAVWRGELVGTVCFQNTLLRLRPRFGTDPEYLAWWCRAAYYGGLLSAIAAGANIYHLSADRVKAIPCAIPSLQVQRNRCTRLGSLEAATRKAIESITHQIDLLNEHRMALITAAVTGELDIPGAVA